MSEYGNETHSCQSVGMRHTHVSLGMRQLYSLPLVSFMCDWSVSRYYLGQRSNILLVDPEIMKQIAVKEFNSFVEREVTGLASFPGLPLFHSLVYIQYCSVYECKLKNKNGGGLGMRL